MSMSMSISNSRKTDPSLFKSSKIRPVSRITVPPPGAFTNGNEDALASLSLLSKGREGGNEGVSSKNKKRGEKREEKRREENPAHHNHNHHHITLSTRGAPGLSSSPASRRQQERIASRNSRAIAKHQQLHQQQSQQQAAHTAGKLSSFLTGTAKLTGTGSRSGSGTVHTGTGTGTTTATVCLSEVSQKRAKERELAAKLHLLQTLRDKDREMTEAAELAASLLQRREQALETSRRQGLALLSSVQNALLAPSPSLPPSPGSRNREDSDRDSDAERDSDRDRIDREEREREKVKDMMRGTAAVEVPEPVVERVVVTRQLSRRKSLQLQESFGQDNMRCDGQLSAVFLSCMYHNSDTDSDRDSDSESDNHDEGGDNDDDMFASPRRKKGASSKPNPHHDANNNNNNNSNSNKENTSQGNQAGSSPPHPPSPSLTTSEIILQSTVPPWEAVARRGRGDRNMQVTVGAKQVRDCSQKLEDRVLAALESAREGNARMSDNAVRTHFGYYYDTDEDEDESLRPVIREEVYIANYFEPFGETFASTAVPPPVMVSVDSETDEGADFFNEFNLREIRASYGSSEEEGGGQPPKKLSAIGNLFSSMSTIEDDGEGW